MIRYKGKLHIVLLIVFLILLLSGCSKTKDILWAYKILNADLSGNEIPIALVFYDSLQNPLPNVCCTLIVDKDTFYHYSDSIGYVLFFIPKNTKKLKTKFPKEINFFTPMTTITGFYNKEKSKIVPDKTFKKTFNNNIEIIYKPEYQEFALKLMKVFQKQKEFIEKNTGLKASPWIVVIGREEKPVISLSDYYVNMNLVPSSLKESYMSGNLHEWTEGTITERLDLYGLKGRNNRWIGDGITQYIVFEWAKREYPEHFYYDLNYIVNELICDDGKTYDLFKWKEASIKSIKKESKRLKKEKHANLQEKGYWYTPYFWAKIIDKSGNKNLIKEFLSELGKRKVRTADSAVALLSRMTGLDIRKELIISSKEINQNIRKYWPIPEIPEGMTFVSCGWSFKMGDSTSKHTSPVHEVYVSPFYIDKYEVSNEQFCKFLNEVGNKKEGGTYWFDEEKNKQIKEVNGKYVPVKGYERHPVTYVTWFGARAYCKWAGKRLPTEAEWELAAGGGFTNYKYPWGEDWCPKCCNWKDDGKVDGYKETAPVDEFEKGRSPYGCYNMAGNVFEWVNDWYGDYPDTSQVDPKGPKSGTHKVQRGGCYKYPPSWMTIHARIAAEPQIAFPCVGFRCAKDFVWNPDSIKASAR